MESRRSKPNGQSFTEREFDPAVASGEGSPPGMMGGFVSTQLYGYSRSTVDIDTLSIVPRDPAAIIRGMGYLPGNELTILRTTYTRSHKCVIIVLAAFVAFRHLSFPRGS